MKKKSIYILLGLCFLLSGCAILQNPFFWRLTLGAVIRAAYKNGGAESVEQKIDMLVVKGRLNDTQAEKIKEAAKKGYNILIVKLEECDADAIVLDDETEKENDQGN